MHIRKSSLEKHCGDSRVCPSCSPVPVSESLFACSCAGSIVYSACRKREKASALVALSRWAGTSNVQIVTVPPSET